MNKIKELEPEVIVLISKGLEKQAVKKLQELRDINLKEAKEIIDLFEIRSNKTKL